MKGLKCRSGKIGSVENVMRWWKMGNGNAGVESEGVEMSGVTRCVYERNLKIK